MYLAVRDGRRPSKWYSDVGTYILLQIKPLKPCTYITFYLKRCEIDVMRDEGTILPKTVMKTLQIEGRDT